ncbi:MAG: 1-phosphofructokinase family hexose kinase [Anaerolineales bacterium]
MSVITVTAHPAVDRVLHVVRLHPNETNRVRVARLYAGGKGNNAARALHRLAVAVRATGFQGGYTGEFCTRSLEAEGIRTVFTNCGALTRTSQLVFEDETGNVYPLYEPGQVIEADEADALIREVSRHLEPGKVCLLCGSSVAADLYARIISLAHERGARCLLDSSGESLRLGLAAKPHLIKVNVHELGECLGERLDQRATQLRALRAVQATGISVVAVSLGAKGLLATDGVTNWHGHLRMGNVVNTVGCGDSLLAGMATALLNNAPLSEIVRWGVACGAANTQVVGAGFIERAVVEQLLPQVNVQPL